jgi:dTDP-4-amino-4,6-dideoxygalactose transaminase
MTLDAIMRVPYLALDRHFDHDELAAALRSHLTNTDFVLGESVTRFEQEFARLSGSEYAVGVNSGTDALFLALKALDIGPGDEVVTAPNSFIATAGAIVAAGARPVFADVGADYNLDPERVAAAITPRTRAILPVHLTGNPAPMPTLLALAGQRGLALIEDAAQAVAATLDGKSVGAFGSAGCFSLHPLKNLPVGGDGGVVTTSSAELAERLRRLRNHGLRNRDEIAHFGFNSRLDSMQATIARFGLAGLAAITESRRRHAARYDALLAGVGGVVIPPRRANAHQVFHTYVVQVEARDALMTYLAGQGIDTKIHYPIPIHLQAPCRDLGYGPGDFPVCEDQARRILSLPINEHLTDAQIDHVADCIRRFYSH